MGDFVEPSASVSCEADKGPVEECAPQQQQKQLTRASPGKEEETEENSIMKALVELQSQPQPNVASKIASTALLVGR